MAPCLDDPLSLLSVGARILSGGQNGSRAPDELIVRELEAISPKGVARLHFACVALALRGPSCS